METYIKLLESLIDEENIVDLIIDLEEKASVSLTDGDMILYDEMDQLIKMHNKS